MCNCFWELKQKTSGNPLKCNYVPFRSIRGVVFANETSCMDVLCTESTPPPRTARSFSAGVSVGTQALQKQCPKAAFLNALPVRQMGA